MRDLARAARVSVPTLYNLFGGKDAILIAELEARPHDRGTDAAGQRRLLRARPRGLRDRHAADRGLAGAVRAAMQMFLGSPQMTPVRRRVEEAFIAIMAGNLGAAKAAGQLADWAQPTIVARHMFASYMAMFISWAVDELDMPAFRAAAASGMCHILIGVARGDFARDVEAELRSLASEPALQPYLEARHVQSG